jgi:hypothetical protein
MPTTKTEIPSNFRALVADFTRDLSTSFPEFSHMWSKWGDEDTTDDQLETLFLFCGKIYPVRFFDILYQNEDIFKPDSDADVYFFPNMSFKLIFNSEGLSANSKKIIWKYLQLMLFTVVGSANDKSDFGETAKLFAGIDEKDLQEKLNETMLNLTGFFEKMSPENNADAATGDQSSPEGDGSASNASSANFENMFKHMPNMEGMPDLNNLQNTLKTLFEGKIGTLAKEMAEEIADEFKDVLGDGLNANANPQDVIKKLMQNPAKISSLMKTVSSKLDEKMKNGSISKDEIMREAGDMMSKMKEMGGSENFKEMFQNMAKSMGGMGKNMKFDQGALDRMLRKEENKTKVLDRAAQRREKLKKEKQDEFEKAMQRKREQLALQQKYSVTSTGDPNHLVFKLNDEEAQEKSFIHPDLAKMLDEEDKAKAASSGEKKNKKKKKKA